MRNVRASPLTIELTSICRRFGVAMGYGETMRPSPLNVTATGTVTGPDRRGSPAPGPARP